MFKVGDRVRIKSWEQLCDEFGEDYDTERICCTCMFVKEMKHLCGRTATINEITGKSVVLKDWSDVSGDMCWNISTDMVELVEKTIVKINGDGIAITSYNGEIVYSTLSCDAKKEEENMNKVLELYKRRKLDELHEKYIEKINKEYEKIDIVKKYETLVSNFEKELSKLQEEIEETDFEYVMASEDNFYNFRIDEEMIKTKISSEYKKDFLLEESNILNMIDEVDAQLSLSNDLEYQKEVLINYDIIDKKTGKMK